MAAIEQPPIDVVAGVIRDEFGRILLSKRPPGRHLENLWEFPGGKLEPNETRPDALRRELNEEVGLETLEAQPLLSVTHAYPEKTIRLWLYLVTQFNGEAKGLEGQALQWVEPDQLPLMELPAADRPVVRVLPLGGQYALSLDPAEFTHTHDFLWRWQNCLESGVRLLCLRGGDDSLQYINPWLPELESLTRQHDARWMVSGRLEHSLNCPADGVHLDCHQLAMLTRRPIDPERLLGASCRNLADIRRAEALGADFITLAPVHPEAGHAATPSLGWDGLAALIAQSGLPVYALGGLDPDQLAQARRLGAFGVAGASQFGWHRNHD
ncbi:MAG: Nudix family hydrolase [Pseudomonadota bacterium]